ncbi:MAG TPA: heme o synthase [Myxococcota bacterium]|nr:heme o synthase [Myxococcota bacterium]
MNAYLALTKPRLLPLVLFSGLPALVLAEGHWPSLGLAAWTLLGTALAAGAANALNSYLERDLDARMLRTRTRPLPAGVLRPERALALGLVLSVLGTGVLWLAAGPAPAGIALAAILFYVFVYTLWLKPRTPFAVVAGGVSGAIAPLIADAAADGRISLAGWILFAIIFLWQPPHFYAIAMNHRADYQRAGFPMLFDRIGDRATCQRSLLWILSLLPVTLAPVWLGMLGWGYGAVTLGLWAWFFAAAVGLLRRQDAPAAKKTFRVSLVYLMGTFLAMLVDLALRSAA